MSDDRLFRETMASMGVTPLDGPAPKPRPKDRPTSQKQRAERKRRQRAARQIRTARSRETAANDPEDDLFLQAMGASAVNAALRTPGARQPSEPEPSPARATPAATVKRPAGGGRPAPPRPDHEDSLFLNSMQRLETPPDKDRPAHAPSPSPPRVERLKPTKIPAHQPEASLDLHGHTVEEGLEKLAPFFAAASRAGSKVVLVVTGKGLRSAGRRGVLKEAVERWLYRDGHRFVRAFSEAPRAQGGRGAFLVHLR